MPLIDFEDTNLWIDNIGIISFFNSFFNTPDFNRLLGTDINFQIFIAVFDGHDFIVICEFGIIIDCIFIKEQFASIDNRQIQLLFIAKSNRSIGLQILVNKYILN